jgi:hypothetical protein
MDPMKCLPVEILDERFEVSRAMKIQVPSQGSLGCDAV